MNTPSPVAVSVERISKEYRENPLISFRRSSPAGGLMALRDVSCTIREGETIGLLGPNGAGKTTLLKIMATLLYPTGGRVMVYGTDIREEPIRARRMMGLVTCDERSFYWRLTGRHNLMFFSSLYGIPGRQASRRIEELLETLGLTSAADDLYQGYSSGMKQKLAIARGLLGDPRIVLYDEPTRSLDPLSAHNIRKWIIAKRKDRPAQTHVIATNQLNEAELLCDRVLIISRGKVISEGPIRSIRDRWTAGNRMVHRVLFRGASFGGTGSALPEDVASTCSEVPGDPGMFALECRVPVDSDDLSRILDALLRAGRTVVSVASEQVPLDELFSDLVQRDGDRASATDAPRGGTP